MCNYWKAVTPGCYDQLTVLRDVAREKMGVNTECELPLAITITYLEQEQHYSRIESVRRASDLTACYIWRKHKIIYDFDDVLAEELCSQADAFEEDYTLPINIILRRHIRAFSSKAVFQRRILVISPASGYGLRSMRKLTSKSSASYSQPKISN